MPKKKQRIPPVPGRVRHAGGTVSPHKVRKKKVPDYPYIRAWCRMMGSYDYYLQNQLHRARAEKAPFDAVFERTELGGTKTGVWARFSEVENESTLDRIRKIMEGWGWVEPGGPLPTG